MYINRKRLRRIIREERMDYFLKKHGIDTDQVFNEFFEAHHVYGYEWTEEELQEFTNGTGISFQIKQSK